MHKREWVKRSDLQQIRIGFNEHEPANFEEFRNDENKFSRHYHAPALRKGNSKAKQKAAYPDYKTDYGELPGIDQWDRNKL